MSAERTANRDLLRELDAEMWLAHRLQQFGHVFAGVTDRELRKQRFREAILEGRDELAIAVRGPGGKPETFRELYERHYREPLRPATRTGEAA